MYSLRLCIKFDAKGTLPFTTSKLSLFYCGHTHAPSAWSSSFHYERKAFAKRHDLESCSKNSMTVVSSNVLQEDVSLRGFPA